MCSQAMHGRENGQAARWDNALPSFARSWQAGLPPRGMEDGQALCLLLQKRDLPPENKAFCVQMQPSGRFVFIQETLNQRARTGFILR